MFFSESDTILEILILSRYKPTSCSYNFVKHLLRTTLRVLTKTGGSPQPESFLLDPRSHDLAKLLLPLPQPTGGTQTLIIILRFS